MYNTLFFLILLSVCKTMQAQNISAFSDLRGYFYAFKEGYTYQLEHQPIKNVKIGLNLFAYTDNTDNFKVYFNGKSRKLQDCCVDAYWPTDHLLVYRIGRQLKVFDQGNALTLCAATRNMVFSDSLVVWYDGFQNSLRMYDKGRLIELESGLVNDNITQLQAASNVAAWVNPQGVLKIRYRNETIEMMSAATSVEIKTGQDIVALYDGSYTNFSIFYKGKDYDLGDFRPASFKTGDEMCAFVNPVDEFKAFIKGTMYDVSSFAPDQYTVKDQMILIEEQGQFRVFIDGKKITLETFIPTAYQARNRTVVWRNLQNGLDAFINGKKVTITNEQVSDFTLSGENTVQYYINERYSHVWMEGKKY